MNENRNVWNQATTAVFILGMGGKTKSAWWFKVCQSGEYALNQKPYMENYLKDGRCSISNNAAERAVKVYVMGRKNFLFHDTVKGATASAIVYTLAETAKVNGLNIRLYLETVMTKMLDYKNEPESILEDLMP